MRDVSLQIPANSTTVLLGPTGSGKSAILQAAIGILRRNSGTISVLGRDPQNRKAACEIRQMCGFVPQNKSLYGNFSVSEMARFSRTLYPSWQNHLEARLFDRFELAPHHIVRDLSATRRALLSMALALCHKPQLLLLDEPFDDLDPAAAQMVLEALVEASGDGTTVVIATNNPERIENIADQAMFFQEGMLALATTVEDIRRNWRRITAHFADNAMLPSLPVSGIEYTRSDGKMVEWVVSKNAAEIIAVIQSLGALSVQVDHLTMYSLFSRFPK